MNDQIHDAITNVMYGTARIEFIVKFYYDISLLFLGLLYIQ